ncbi:MAG: hypothetical protein M1813_001318 [Trichoglossum hirsutum]|jgi:hypothetical protein|nr:MAG: hypothetical protein M1813_001318 [Trichoglossum hirsutum]
MALGNDHSQVRTRTELIIKTVAIHAAVLIAAGHLITLRKVSRRSRKAAYWQLAWFFVVPTLPIAEILDRLVGCVRLAWCYGRRYGDASYYTSAVLGVQVMAGSAGDDTGSTPLLEADYRSLQRVSKVTI